MLDGLKQTGFVIVRLYLRHISYLYVVELIWRGSMAEYGYGVRLKL